MFTNRRFLHSILTVVFSLACLLVPAATTAEIWTVVAIDPRGDGSDPGLADAAQLCYRYDKAQDLLWFRVSLWGVPKQETFGINIAIDTGMEEFAKMNWWGMNKDFRFDRLVTARVMQKNGNYQGTIGVADAAGAGDNNFNNLIKDNQRIRVEGDSIVIGIKRTDITDKMKMNLIASVGSSEQWNDDIPNARAVALDLSAARPSRGLREIDLARNNFRFPSDYKTLPDNQPPVISTKGNGRQAMILIPGVYSGKDVFDEFIARNQSQYKFYVVTPPGLNGTPARPLPPETTSFGEFTWTRRLERDILDLIAREKLDKPVTVTHGFPGSLAVEEVAVQHPEKVGGIIELASLPLQSFPSLKGRKLAPHERVEVVDEGWAQKWFKYVTPETWESNNYQPEMFANDPKRAEEVRQQIESAPLQVKIRYLAEFMASDHTDEFANLTVPLLALRPGFNESFLANPANAYYKAGFLDAWDAFARNSRIELRTIPGARALIFEDQPELANQAISEFVHKTVAQDKISGDLIKDCLHVGFAED